MIIMMTSMSPEKIDCFLSGWKTLKVAAYKVKKKDESFVSFAFWYIFHGCGSGN